MTAMLILWFCNDGYIAVYLKFISMDFFSGLYNMVQKQHGITWKKMTLTSNQLKNSNNSNSLWQLFVKVNTTLLLVFLLHNRYYVNTIHIRL